MSRDAVGPCRIVSVVTTLTDRDDVVRDQFSLTDVAAMTGESRSTVRRMLNAGRFPNAWQDSDGRKAWWVPATDLGAAGLGQTRPDRDLFTDRGQSGRDEVTRLREEMDGLRQQLADVRVQLAEARAQAEERGAQIADLRFFGRLLGEGADAPDRQEAAQAPRAGSERPSMVRRFLGR
jgi:hypothetical protein